MWHSQARSAFLSKSEATQTDPIPEHTIPTGVDAQTQAGHSQLWLAVPWTVAHRSPATASDAAGTLSPDFSEYNGVLYPRIRHGDSPSVSRTLRFSCDLSPHPKRRRVPDSPNLLGLPPLSHDLLTRHLDEEHRRQQQQGLIPTLADCIRIGRDIRSSTALGNAWDHYRPVYLVLELRGYLESEYIALFYAL